jgi:hypothetical protein
LSQQGVEIFLVHDFHVRLRLALLVLQGAIQQQNTRILNATAHLRMGHILVEHNTIQNVALRQVTTRDLLQANISLDVDFLVVTTSNNNLLNGLNSHLHHLATPSGRKLGTNGSSDNFSHFWQVIDIDCAADSVASIQSSLQGTTVTVDNDSRVEAALQQRFSNRQNLST